MRPEVILLDEPCSALDPISTAKIEELIDELKDDYTIAIVTHNMQQAARVSDFTAFMYLGELVEYGETTKHLHRAEMIAAPRTTSPAASAERDDFARSKSPATRDKKMNNLHTIKAFDADLQDSRDGRRDGRPRRKISRRRRGRPGRGTARWRNESRRRTREIDALQREIEEKAIHTIARRQPMAVDLREIVGAIRISADLERIGDLAKNIAKRAAMIAGEGPVAARHRRLEAMRDLAAGQLNDVLDAFAQRDPERARAVWERDVELDALEDSVFRDLLTFMMEDPRNITFCTHLAVLFPRTSNVSGITPPISPKLSSTSSLATRCPSIGRAGSDLPTL